MKRTLAVLAAAAVTTMALAGCATKAGTGATTPEAGSNRPATSVTSEALPEETPTEESSPTTSEDVVLKFGQSYAWEDGLKVTISKPVKFTPSEYAAGTGKYNVIFTVTILNKTGKRFDPAMFTTSAQSANLEAESIFDSDIGGSPSTALLNGREVQFKIGYSVANPKDIVLEVHPSFDHAAAMFQN